MRLKLLGASVIGLAVIAIVAIGIGVAKAQVPASTPAEAPPTLEELRKAVASLRGDRIKRQASYDELTPQQKPT